MTHSDLRLYYIKIAFIYKNRKGPNNDMIKIVV